ncbi:MAG: glycosyltransferase [Candidatus Eisenbacteria sp.]|nr:glycosyltransferase [Candidatus Eisenbacteria bacterium]
MIIGKTISSAREATREASVAPAPLPESHGMTDGIGWSGCGGNLGYLAKMIPRISETFILREALALRREGIPVRIFSLLPPTRDHRMHAAARALLPEVEILPQPRWYGGKLFWGGLADGWRHRPAAVLREALRLALRPRRRTLRRFFRAVILARRLREANIVHLHAAWAHTPASVARIATRLVGIPWSMGAHAKDIHLAQRSSLAKKLRAARFTVTCTRANQDLLQEIAERSIDPDFPVPSILMLHHGVDTSFFTSLRDVQPVAARMNILSVGRLVPKKGFDILIEAVALLRDRGLSVHLEIVGEGDERQALERQIRTRDLDQIVTLKGMLVLDEVRAAYQRSSVMALASRITADGDRDGIPNTLAEAMACGLPVVASRLPSIAELVVDGESGFLVAPEDPAAMADALERFLRDEQLRRRLGHQARKRVCQVFDSAAWEKRFVRRLARARGIERVLYLSPDRGVPVRGAKGASVHVRSVVRALTAIGVETRLVSARPVPTDGASVDAPVFAAGSGKRTKRAVGRLAGWLRGGVPLERALLRLLDNLGLYREGLRQARAWRPGMIYERYALTAFAGALLARRLGIPHILEVNAPLAEEEARFRGLRLGSLARRLERSIWRRADCLVVVSPPLAEIARQAGVDPQRILVLPNAVDPALFHPRADGETVRRRLGIDNGGFVIGFSGSLKPWHGVHHLLQAFARMAGQVPDARVLVVGDGPERARLEALTKELGLGDRVHFVGAVEHENVATYLRASNLLVAPYGSLENHWFSPLKVAEYLAVGRPVIASAIGELREQLGSDRGVLFLDPGDEEALAACLIELASNQERYRLLAGAAGSGPQWTWRHVAAEVLAAGERARRELWGVRSD